MRESRSGTTTVVVLCSSCAGGSFSRSAIRLVLKFWCNWQIRQSLQPPVEPAGFAVCSE